MRLNQKQREVLAEKLMDLANIIVGTLVVGQFISNQEFSTTSFTFGLLLAGTLYLAGLGFSRKQPDTI